MDPTAKLQAIQEILDQPGDAKSLATRHGDNEGAKPRDPFAELGPLFDRVDPETFSVGFMCSVCMICGAASGWADSSPGTGGAKAVSDFKVAHEKATQGSGTFGAAGHRRWHHFEITRARS